MLLSQSEVIHSALTGTQICCICNTHIFLCLFGWQSSVHPTETVERQEKWCGERKENSSVSSTTHLFSLFSTSKTHSWASVFWSLCNSVHFCGNGFQISLLLLYSYTYENVCFSVCLMVFLCVASPLCHKTVWWTLWIHERIRLSEFVRLSVSQCCMWQLKVFISA